VSIGGMVVHPGDYVIGDGDGVLAVPRDTVDEVLAAAEAQNAKEQATLKAIADGTVDRRWVDETLRQKGCRLP
jgi:regulator of RNase E activity RraA